MSIYRHIYKGYYGSIPVDEEGRSFEIHHIDGNHNNDDISNLKCLSIQDHYDIHYSQGDWYACRMLALRMNITPEEKSRLASSDNQKRIENGTHNLLGGEKVRQRVNDGTHHLLGGEIQRKSNLKRVEAGTHLFLGGKVGGEHSRKRVEAGTHNFLNSPTYICPHCCKIGKGTANMKRWHFDNCKLNQTKSNDVPH